MCGTGMPTPLGRRDYETTNFYRNGSIECVVVGDRGVGKTSMLSARAEENPLSGNPDEFYAKVLQPTNDPNINPHELDLFLKDTNGSHDDADAFQRRSALCDFACADAILVCFAIDDRKSFENVQNRWLPEVKLHDLPEAKNNEARYHRPVFIVGTKSELRDVPNCETVAKALAKSELGSKLSSDLCRLMSEFTAHKDVVSFKEARKLQRLRENTTYIECSALREGDISELFDKIASAVLYRPSRFYPTPLSTKVVLCTTVFVCSPVIACGLGLFCMRELYDWVTHRPDHLDLPFDNVDHASDNVDHAIDNHEIDNDDNLNDNVDHASDNVEHASDNVDHAIDNVDNSIDKDDHAIDKIDHGIDDLKHAIDDVDHAIALWRF